MVHRYIPIGMLDSAGYFFHKSQHLTFSDVSQYPTVNMASRAYPILIRDEDTDLHPVRYLKDSRFHIKLKVYNELIKIHDIFRYFKG